LRELEARIQAVMRRYQAQAASAGVIRTGEVVVDDERKEVTVRGKPVALSPREFEILRLLTSRPGKVFSSAEILGAAWPDREGATVEDVKKYIHMLRRKIERDPAKPRIIVTVRGFGYRLSAEAP
ncbi:MAG TPA: response regulator transcription factor, partial [bacterium]|nr:response regulator transcription factor [bacterium]